MAVKIRLARGGAKKRPYYRIVAADIRNPRDGRYLERLGSYNPLLAKNDEKRVIIDVERIKSWLDKGAKPTDRVARMLEAADILPARTRNNPKKAQPGKKAQERAEELAAKEAEVIEDAESSGSETAEQSEVAEAPPVEEATADTDSKPEAAAEEPEQPEKKEPEKEAAADTDSKPETPAEKSENKEPKKVDAPKSTDKGSNKN